MTTEAKNPEIQLTEAEIAMIQLKREQEELNKKKEENSRLIKEGEEITKKKEQIKADTKRDAQLVAEIERLFNELPKGEYELVDISKLYEYSCYNYHSSRSFGEREEVFFKEQVKREARKIVHTESKSEITVHVHHVSISSFRSVEKGFRFKLDLPGVYDGKNKNLSSAATIDRKIKEYVVEHKRKTEAAKAKLEGIEWLINQINEMYPQAVVTQEQESGYRVEYGPDKGWREGAKYIQAAFTSGLILTFTWTKNSEGELEVVRKGFNLSKISDEKREAFINSLI